MNETPRKLGRYELIRRIAVGGMGEIYLARTRGTAGFEKTVIIKTILPHLAEEDEFVEKFLDEGRIVVNLTHGNIVPVFDMDEADGEYFIAMEYVPGRDVRDVLARLRDRGETMPPDLAAYIISEVCEGLGYAHRKKDDDGKPLDIVHRDVSPSNILISTEGEVKIIDFGVARAADRRAKTVSGRIQGKCCYMSPEQARGDSLDHRSDIFSTAVVFYEMLTNVRPFEGESDLKSLDLVRECEFDAPSSVEAAVPEELDGVIERALAEDPEDRYDRIDEMKVDLMEYLVSRGRAVTSEEVAEFLADLFPEGLEREAFREVRQEADEPSGPMELDDALEYQLDQIDGEGSVDPLDETLPEGESDEVGVGNLGRTETITPEPGQGESEAGLEITEGGRSTAPESPDAKERGSDGRSPSSEHTETEDVSDARFSRWQWILVAAGVVLLGGAVGVAAFSGASRGTVDVDTRPSGAKLFIDGSRYGDEKTPTQVRLRTGEHTLKVSKKGYRSQRREFRLSEGGRQSFSIQLERIEPEDEPKIRTFVLKTKPPGGRLWVNQKSYGQGPQKIEVGPGETKFVEANKKGCDREVTAVYYGREERVVPITLNCSERSDAGTKKQASAAENSAGGDEEKGGGRVPRRVAIRFGSEPEGASVRVDGEKLGRTPLEREFRRGRTLDVVFEKSGYESLDKRVQAGAAGGSVEVVLDERQMGCLNFFAVHPQYNELAIDGEWLDGRRQKLQNYELTPGTHEIRVRNPDANKDETFTFEVEPGDDCTSLTVWDPDEG